MSPRRSLRQPVKASARMSGRRRPPRDIDLNAPAPAEIHQPEAPTRSAASRISGASVPAFARSRTPRRAASVGSAPIDVEVEADDVVYLSETASSPQVVRTRNRSTRSNPVVIDVDDDPEVITGEKPGTKSSLRFRSKRRTSVTAPNGSIIDCDVDDDNDKAKRSKSAPEPNFTCPVCLNSLKEPSSTICGHIFCQECIKRSIRALKSCPTCRKKLTLSNFHRVYLPNAC